MAKIQEVITIPITAQGVQEYKTGYIESQERQIRVQSR